MTVREVSFWGTLTDFAARRRKRKRVNRVPNTLREGRTMKRCSLADVLLGVMVFIHVASLHALAQGSASLEHSTITAGSSSIVANGLLRTTITVQLKDDAGVDLNRSGGVVNLSTTAGRLGGIVDVGNGTYTSVLTSAIMVGDATVTGTLNGELLSDSEIVTFARGPASLTLSTISASVGSMVADGSSTSLITVRLRSSSGADQPGNVGVVMLSTTAGRLSSVEIDTLRGIYVSTLTAPLDSGDGSAVISGTIAGEAMESTVTVALTAGPTVSDYRSVRSGMWNDASTWQVYTESGWVAASSAPAEDDGTTTILSPHAVTVAASRTIDQLVVTPGAALTVGAVVFTIKGSINNIYSTLELLSGSHVRIDQINLDGGNLILHEGSRLDPLTDTSNVHTYDSCTVSVPSTANFNTWLYIETGTTTLTSPTANGALKGGLFYVGRSNGVPTNLVLDAGKNFLINSTMTVRPLGVVRGPGTMTFSGDNGDYEILLTGNGTIDADVFFQSQNGNAQILQGSESPGALYRWGNITIDNPSGVTLRYSSGFPDVVINGTLTLANGIFSNHAASNFGTGTIRFGDNAKIIRSGGKITHAPIFGMAIDVEYVGNTPVTTGWELLPEASVLRNLTINNSAGVTLDDDIVVNGSISCIAGGLVTASNTITLTGEAYVSETVGNTINGIVQSTKSIGTEGVENFGGLGINVTSGADDVGILTVKRVTGKDGAVAVNGNTGIASVWQVSTSHACPSGRTVVLSWLSDYDNDKSLLAMRVWGSTDGGGTWYDVSGSDQAATGRAIPFVYMSTTPGNSVYTVSDDTAPLPIELSSFTSATHGNNVVLTWETATETNNFGFQIERSVDKPELWRTIGFVQGAGAANSPNAYTFVEHDLLPGKYLYRLKQIDTDGTFKYVDPIEVDIGDVPGGFGLSQNFPNPFNPLTTIAFAVAERSDVAIRMYDMIGREVQVLVEREFVPGNYRVSFDGTNVSSGVYVFRMTAAYGRSRFIETRQFVLMK